MVRSRNLAMWGLIAVGAFAGCRVGYDEIFIIEGNSAGEGGTGASGGAGGSNGATGGSNGATGGSSGDTGGTESGGEAGADATGGTSVSGGSAGAAASGGSATTGGEGGAAASGGSSGNEAGGTGGSSGGTAGTSGAATSGTSGASGEGGASDGGTAGVSGGGAGGVSGGGTSGLGSGGFAGAASLGDCRTDTFAGHDYVFCNVNISWTAARDNCASIGMWLVRVDDAAESQWVYDNVYDAPPRQGVWIGGSDLAVEGEWRWMDGALFWLGDASGSAQNGLFSAWYATQPSGQEPRDCAALDGNTLGWYDLDCAIPQPYACESP